MRPELERRPGTRQFHGGPIAAFIDIVGDFAIGMLVGGGVPTINLRIDYLRPAIGTRRDGHSTRAPAGTHRRPGRHRRRPMRRASWSPWAVAPMRRRSASGLDCLALAREPTRFAAGPVGDAGRTRVG